MPGYERIIKYILLNGEILQKTIEIDFPSGDVYVEEYYFPLMRFDNPAVGAGKLQLNEASI